MGFYLDSIQTRTSRLMKLTNAVFCIKNSVMRKYFFLLLLAYSTGMFAGKGSINFVETTVRLAEDGAAIVGYTMQYRVVSGELHGFYFSGNDRLKIQAFATESYAIDDFGNRYDLDISKVGSDKWDIILANNAGVSSGTVTYFFYFSTHFNKAGYLVNTETNEGKMLTAFNWSPVQWDEASKMDHYTLTVITPHDVETEEEVLRNYYMDQNVVQTESWVNEKFLIDYQASPKGKLKILFHKNKPGNRFDMRTQFYMPADWFKLEVADTYMHQNSSSPVVEYFNYRRDKRILLLVFVGVVVLFFLLVRGKHKSMVKAKAGLDDINWGQLDWSPPKLELSNYRVKGKICKDLTTLEAAFYLEIPFKSILSGMIAAMENENLIEVISSSPLRVNADQYRDIGKLGEYESQLYISLADDGELSQQELEDLMKLAVKNIQKKAWDCDVEATKEYYRQQMGKWEAKNIPEDKREKLPKLSQ
jgi:hypothetical protein